MASLSSKLLQRLGKNRIAVPRKFWTCACRSYVRSALATGRRFPNTGAQSNLYRLETKAPRLSLAFTSTFAPRQASSELSAPTNRKGPMGTTYQEMHETGFNEWGFVIYRCTYGDDEAWERYVGFFKEVIHESLAKDGCKFLDKHVRWTIVEDEADLQAASKLRVRQRFRDWRDQNCVWRKEEGVSRRLPRFTYCLHVGRDCLGTVDAHAAAKRTETPYESTPPLVAGLVDGDFVDLSSIDSYVCPPVEGCTQEYVGWEYIMVDFIPAFYNDYHYYNLESGTEYKRPPLIAPLNVGSMRMGVGKGGIIPSK